MKQKAILSLILIILEFIYTNGFSAESKFSGDKFSCFGLYSTGWSNGDFGLYESLSHKEKKFDNGLNSGYKFGIGYEHLLLGKFFAGLDVYYQGIKYDFTENEFTKVSSNGIIETGEFSYQFITKNDFLILKPYISFSLLDKLSISLALNIGVPLKDIISSVKTIVKPDWATFIDNNGNNTYERKIVDIIQSNINSLNTGLQVGFSYKLPINRDKTLSLEPGININYTFTKIYKDYPWTSLSLDFGLRLSWSFLQKNKYNGSSNKSEIKSLNKVKSFFVCKN